VDRLHLQVRHKLRLNPILLQLRSNLSKNSGTALAAIVIIVVASLVFLLRPRDTSNAIVLAKITGFSGPVHLTGSHPGDKVETVRAAQPIFAGSVLSTGPQAQIDFSLTTGEDFTLFENGKVAFQESAETPGTLRMIWISGVLKAQAAEQAGRTVQIERDGRLLSWNELGEFAGTSPTLRTLRLSDQPLLIATKGAEPTATPRPTPVRKESTDHDDTLSTQEIQRPLQAQGPFLRHCYLSFLNRTHSAESHAHFEAGLRIEPTGQVKSVRILGPQNMDSILQKCLGEVFERMHFRSFTGDPIQVDGYPIEFE
jgi:hypothetical protein